MPNTDPAVQKEIADRAGTILSGIAALSARLGTVEIALGRLLDLAEDKKEQTT